MKTLEDRIVIFGVGLGTERLFQGMNWSGIKILALVDSFKSGEMFHGRKIESPEVIRELEYDTIWITATRFKEIERYLIADLQVDQSKILHPKDINQRYWFPNIVCHKMIFFTQFATGYLSIPKMPSNKDRYVLGQIFPQKEEWDMPSQSNDDEKVFIIESCSYGQYKKEGFIRYLKSAFPNAKFVFWLCDLCDGDYGYIKVENPDYIQDIRNTFDLIYTYHQREAEKYGFIFREQIYNTPAEIKVVDEQETVFFMGHAKNRLEILHSIYQRLTGCGIKCDFYISNVSEEKRLADSDIKYIDKYFDYSEYLEKMKKASCILEICQKGDETSYRYAEAVIYNKKLLSNDISCKKRKFYNDQFIQCFTECDEVDIDWIRRKVDVDFHYNNEFSLDNFILDIEKRLGKHVD